MILLKNTEKQVINFPKTKNIDKISTLQLKLVSEIDNEVLDYGFWKILGYFTDFYPLEIDLNYRNIKPQVEYKYFLRERSTDAPLETGLLKIIENTTTSTEAPAKYNVKAQYTQYEF